MTQSGLLRLKRRGAAVYKSRTVPAKWKYWFKRPLFGSEAKTYFEENMNFMMNTHSVGRV
jgi:hypothetical protein